MALIAADDRHVERSLLKIVEFAEKAGSEFSNDLTLKCTEGNLSVEAPRESVGKMLVRIPWDCLAPLPPFRLSVKDDQILISSFEEGVTNECIALMESLLELFNITQKIARHRQNSPWRLIASHPTLLDRVMQGRANVDFTFLQQLIASGDEDELMLHSFLNSRILGYKVSARAPHYPVLMPVVDLFNHHFRGALYEMEDDPAKQRSVAIARSIPLPGTGNECFACYGAHDSFDTWMTYGFVDKTAQFVCSIAMTIDLQNLDGIRVTNIAKPRGRRNLPLSVADLHFYVPAVLAKREKHVEVGRILIPGPAAPKALRRTLGFLISEIQPTHPKQRDLVMNAEEQIIAANRAYYRDLIEFAQTLQAQPILRSLLSEFLQVCELQLTRLDDYGTFVKG